MPSARTKRHPGAGEIGAAESALLRPLAEALGPLAVVDLETTGLPSRRDSEIIEIGAVLLEPDGRCSGRIDQLVRPRRAPDAFIRRLTGLAEAELAGAPPLGEIAATTAQALRGRVLIAHNAEFERHFLARFVSASLAEARYLDTQDVLGLTHPDAPDLRLETFTRMLLGHEEKHRALADALDTLQILAGLAQGARRAEPRYVNARRALMRYDPNSVWLRLLGAGAPESVEASGPDEYVRIGASREAPVAFDEQAIADALSDEARGRRYFERYRVRPQQIELARHFHRTLCGGGELLLEGGTGVGKSLAYLAAVIPFAMQRAEAGERGAVVISTRTKLLQDQLLEKDIAAAARFLGHPGLRALSIKGRANYICERRLQQTLAQGHGRDLFDADRRAFALLSACARTRPAGEVGGMPAALLRRNPLLRDLLRRSVSQRAEQCTREQCAGHPGCPFGRRRRALARAHLIVANHDLLLRWPPDYPRLGHVIADEGHELAGVADEVYAATVRPEEVFERIDEIFGSRVRESGALESSPGLLPAAQRADAAPEVERHRRDLLLDFQHLGRLLAGAAGDYAELQLAPEADRQHPEAAALAEAAAARISALARLAARLQSETETDAELEEREDWRDALSRQIEALHSAAEGLDAALCAASIDVVAAFERLVPPYDRWRLVLHPVRLAPDFHRHFMQGLESFAAVSASLFVAGDAFAALGELELEEQADCDPERVCLPSPFDYAAHMRVVALRGPSARGESELVADTARVLACLARLLGGRTLALFTSLRRMQAVADRLAGELAQEPIEVLVPRTAGDDPAALVRRFQAVSGAAVLLGARTFWQGLDIAGAALQAVVIEKLPFEVPTELRRRREARVADLGLNAFERVRLGKMLLHLKQMTGRLIRSEEDRGIVVIVDARSDRRYFGQLELAFPAGPGLRLIGLDELPAVLTELELGHAEPGAGIASGRAPGVDYS